MRSKHASAAVRSRIEQHLAQPASASSCPGRGQRLLEPPHIVQTLQPRRTERYEREPSRSIARASSVLVRVRVRADVPRFEEALGSTPEHEDALAGLGEVLLKFGERTAALACFDRILALGFATITTSCAGRPRAVPRGRARSGAALLRDRGRAHPDSAEAAASIGYATHRLADRAGRVVAAARPRARSRPRRRPRVLANLLYDRGEYEARSFTWSAPSRTSTSTGSRSGASSS